MDLPDGFDPTRRADYEILVRDLDETIGISLDLQRDRMYFTDMRGGLDNARGSSGSTPDLLQGSSISGSSSNGRYSAATRPMVWTVAMSGRACAIFSTAPRSLRSEVSITRIFSSSRL